MTSKSERKEEAISFHIERAVFRPLARNDLSFREIVVGFIAGLNFLWQGQRSDLSDGRVKQSRSETRGRERERESGRKSEAERRRQSDIRDGTQTLVYPLTHPLPFCITHLTPLPVYTHLGTHLRESTARKVKPCRTVSVCRHRAYIIQLPVRLTSQTNV